MEKTKMPAAPVDLYPRAPNAWGVVEDAKKAGFIASLWAAKVLFVFGAGRCAQVRYAVICRIAIDVVNFLGGGSAVKIKPRKTVCIVLFAKNRKTYGATFCNSSNGAKHGVVRRLFDPRKQTSLRVV